MGQKGKGSHCPTGRAGPSGHLQPGRLSLRVFGAASPYTSPRSEQWGPARGDSRSGGTEIESLEAVSQGLEPNSNGQPFGDSEALQSLFTQGREVGFLTFEHIASTLEEVEVTKEQVSSLHSHLVENGIGVISQERADGAKEQRVASTNGQAKKAELDLT